MVEYIVAIDVTWVRFLADTSFMGMLFRPAVIWNSCTCKQSNGSGKDHDTPGQDRAGDRQRVELTS